MPPNQAPPTDEAVGTPELQISYPDATLPGGQARSIVSLRLDKSSWVEAVDLEPGTLPEGFAEAVTAAFMGQQFGLRRASELRLCLQVEFKEGEVPTWQIINTPEHKSDGMCWKRSTRQVARPH